MNVGYEEAYKSGYAAYSCFYGKKRYKGGHQASMLIKRDGKPWKKPLMVTHSCGNKLCVNPDHLELKDYSGNYLDSIALGERTTALSDEQAVEIAAFHKENKGMTQKAIGEHFGISRQMVWNVLSGHTYGRVTGLGK